MSQPKPGNQSDADIALLRLLIENVTDYAMFVLDPNGRVATWNPGAERIKGYKAEEIIGQHFSRFYPQDVVDRGWPEHELKVAVAAGRFEDEGWRLRKDGSRFWANVVITALRDERGELRGFAKVTRDLTERRQAEERLRRSEERFRHMVEGVKDYAIFLLDPEGHVTTWNAGAERIKQYKAHEIIGRHFSTFYPNDVADSGWPAHELRVAAADGRFEDEGWRVRRDGSQFWANVVITAIRDDRGELFGFTKVTRDLTSRKQAEENARRLAEETAARQVAHRERERLQVTLASIGDAVISTDAKGRVEFLNAVAEELVGWKSEEAVGQGLEDIFRIVNESTREPVENPALRALRDGKIVGLANHTVLIARDGTERPIDDSAAPIQDAAGNVIGSVLVFRDIAQRRRAERELHTSEARKSAILETALDCVITIDQQGRVVEFNSACEKTFGYRREQVLGQELDGFIIPPSLRQRFRRGMARYLATGEGPVLGRRLELTALRSDGTEFPVELSTTRITADGPPLFTAYIRDISERKRAEQYRNVRLGVTSALAEARTLEEGARGVLEAVCRNLGWDLGFVWTLDGKANALVCRQSWREGGRDATEFETASCQRTFAPGEGLPGRVWSAGKPEWILDVVKHADFPRAAPAAREGLRSAAASPLIVGERTIGVIEFFTQALREPDPDLIEIIGTVGANLGQFIERTAAEKRRQETEQRLQAVFNQQFQFMAILDPDGRVVEANETCFTVTGVQREQVVARLLWETPWWDGFPQVQEQWKTNVSLAASGAGPVTAEVEYRGANGTTRHATAVVTGLTDETGRVTSLIVEGHDDTERKRGEAVLAVQKRALEMLVRGAPLPDVLDALCEVIEVQAQERLVATVLLLDEDGKHLRSVAGRRAPPEYAQALDGVAIGPCVGSCGTAAYRAEPVVVTDIASDPLWADFRKLALSHGLRACWSTPILSSQGQVLGTFAVYSATPRSPSEEERRLVGLLTSTASVAVERRRAEEAQKQSEAHLRAVVETTPACITIVAEDGTLVSMNSAGLRMVDAMDAGDVKGASVYNLIRPQHRDAFRKFNEQICRGESGTLEFEIEGLKGTRRHMETHAAPLTGPGGSMLQLAITLDITDRRRAEAALRESEEKLRLLADTIPQLAWMARPDGHIFWYNRRWYEYTGTTPEQMEGWGWESVHDPAVLPRVVERWKWSIETGEPFDMVFPLRGADGELRTFLTRVNPLRNGDGHILYWFGTNTDVTELRQTRAALADSEERLRLALDAGRMGVWDWNVRTGDLKWSDSLEPLHGLAPGTFGGTFEHFQQLIHPDDRQAVQSAIRQALESGGEFYVEFRNLRQNGGIHWIAGSGKVFYGDDRRPLRMIGIGLDVTPRKRSEQTARFLADASAALAVLVDFDSTLQKVASLAVPHFADWVAVDVLEENGTLRRVAVAHVETAKVQLAHDIHRRFPPDPSGPSGVWHILRTSQAEIVPVITDEMLVASIKDDELLRIMRELGLKSYIGVPLTVRGKTLGVLTFIVAESDYVYDETDLAVANDLAGRAAIAVENSQLYRELRDADLRKDEFLAMLAHELRNPLAPIRNGLQVLRLAGEGGEMVDEALTMMERQLTHMVRLVDDLLDVSRITRNKLELRKERVSLATVVHSAVETSRPLIEQSGHTFSVTLTPIPAYLDADPVRLAQVFSNLLNNAAKYTEPGGKITLTTETNGTEAVVRVRDNGLGIPAEAQARIFEMFSQVDRNMERAQGGLGIGLTLVRRLTEMHGGTVEVRSEGPGLGSEFTVRIPVLRENSRGLTNTGGGPGTVAGSKRRILVVDDNKDAAESLGMMLKLMGNEIRTAADGLAAVELAETYRPEMILLDIGLPKLNGYDACRRIREQPWSKGMVIVALTGWGQEGDRRRSQEAGFDHHLVKPVEVADLANTLNRLRNT